MTRRGPFFHRCLWRLTHSPKARCNGKLTCMSAFLLVCKYTRELYMHQYRFLLHISSRDDKHKIFFSDSNIQITSRNKIFLWQQDVNLRPLCAESTSSHFDSAVSLFHGSQSKYVQWSAITRKLQAGIDETVEYLVPKVAAKLYVAFVRTTLPLLLPPFPSPLSISCPSLLR